MEGESRINVALRILATPLFSFLFVSALISCSPEDRVAQVDDSSSLDLIPIYQVARIRSETGAVELLSPEVSYYLKGGWSEPYEDEGGRPVVAAVSNESVLRYMVLRPADRWLEFTVRLEGILGSPNKQVIEVRARKRILGTFNIETGEESTLEVFIPAARQTIGNNRIYFQFTEFHDNPEFLADRKRFQENPYRGVAAYFSAFNIYFGDVESLDRDEIRRESDYLRLVADGRYLSQFPNSDVSYAFEIEPGAKLSLAGTVQGSGESGDLNVTVEVRNDAKPQWQPLWSRSVSLNRGSEKDFDADIALEPIAGGSAEIRMSAMSSERFCDAAVIWKALSLGVAGTTVPAGDRSPINMADKVRNVVIIILDAARPDHFGCYGDDRGMTPHIDDFAQDSLIFRNAICAAPYTIASVASTFSGLVPESHGVRYYESVFPENIDTLQEAFKRSGYFTLVMSGNPFITYKLGMTRGFDEEIYLRTKEAKAANLSTMDLEALERGVRMAADSGKPAYIFCHFLPPHWPYNPPPPFNGKYIAGGTITRDERRLMRARHGVSPSDPAVSRLHNYYMNNMLYADHITHRLLEMLKEHDLYEDSLIIVTADHGEAFADHGLLGHGNTIYDEALLLPFIARVPGIGPGEVKAQIGLIDLFPTFVELLDLHAEGDHFEGRSVASLFAGESLLGSPYYYSRATGDKLIFTLRGQRYKYIFFDPREELYDLQADPLERTNLLEKHPVLAAMLRQRGMMIVAAGVSGKRAVLEPEQEEELRNLGYIH